VALASAEVMEFWKAMLVSVADDTILTAAFWLWLAWRQGRTPAAPAS
jgi:hypothetical protein